MRRIRGNALALDFGGMRFIGGVCLVNLDGSLCANGLHKADLNNYGRKEIGLFFKLPEFSWRNNVNAVYLLKGK